MKCKHCGKEDESVDIVPIKFNGKHTKPPLCLFCYGEMVNNGKFNWGKIDENCKR